MPCRSDYLEATGLEKGLKETAELAAFVADRLGIPLPEDIRVQTITYYTKDVGQVQWLCKQIRGMSDLQLASIVYDGRKPTSRRLADWWDKHEADDLAQAKEAALAKLTPADKRALGLDNA